MENEQELLYAAQQLSITTPSLAVLNVTVQDSLDNRESLTYTAYDNLGNPIRFDFKKAKNPKYRYVFISTDSPYIEKPHMRL